MAVDKDLFMYDLSLVSIMKNAGPYIKEWLDYYILAGVDHFYIYDNGSTDNFKEVLQPYIDDGTVTYIFYPVKHQDEAYNDAKRDYRFFSRYMAFIDDDEFILPKSHSTISEVADDIFSKNPNIAGFAVNWRMFGSNYQEKADYNIGILKRFTRCDDVIHDHVKTIFNPRRIKYFSNPHFGNFFVGNYSVDENLKIVRLYYNPSPSAEKIVINHYGIKSREEFIKKIQRGYPDNYPVAKESSFSHDVYNKIENDDILKYIKKRKKMLKDENRTLPSKINYVKVYSALVRNLSPAFSANVPREFYNGNLETFLICRKLAEYLRGNQIDVSFGNFLEELALKSIYINLQTNHLVSDLEMLFSELPYFLSLNYPVVKDICKFCINIIPNLSDVWRKHDLWREFSEADYLLAILKNLDYQ